MGPGLGLGNTMGMGEISSGNIHIQNVHSEGARNSSRSGVGIGSSKKVFIKSKNKERSRFKTNLNHHSP